MFFDWIIFKIFPVTNYVKYPTQAYRSKSILSWASDWVRLLDLFWTISILKSRFTSTLSWTMTRNWYLSSVHFGSWWIMSFFHYWVQLSSAAVVTFIIFLIMKKKPSPHAVPQKRVPKEKFSRRQKPRRYIGFINENTEISEIWRKLFISFLG